MMHSDRSQRLRRLRQQFLLALSIGLGTCAPVLHAEIPAGAEKPAGDDGTVSIRLMLEPSLPAKAAGAADDAKTAEVAAETPASTTPEQAKTPTLLARPVDAPAPRPVSEQVSEPASQIAKSETVDSDPQLLGETESSPKVEAQAVTVPSRRFLQRRSRTNSSKQSTARTQTQTSRQETASRPNRYAPAPAMQPITDPVVGEEATPLKTARVQTTRRGAREAEPAPLPPGAGVRQLGSSRLQRAPVEALDEGLLLLDSDDEPSVDESAQTTLSKTKDAVADSDAIEIIDLDAIDADRKKSQKDEDANGECPGSPDGPAAAPEIHLDDIPLEETEHPYDAPRAERTDEREISSSRLQKVAPETPTQQFTARELEIRDGINRCLNYFLTHPENVVRRGPWALMHAALPFGVETEVIAGRRRVNAIGWMCYNGVCAKQRMFQPTRSGFRTNLGPGVQGHEGQFLAILAQSQVSREYPLKIGNRSYKVEDLIRYEMATCRERSELTFKLIGLSHYLPGDSRWRDNRGRIWNLEKMVKEELAQPIQGAACGGTHRLMGLTYSLLQRQRDGLPITGHWQRSETFLKDYIRYAFTLQNPDGSFSTEWFEGRGMKRDVERKVQTTGHILEWLIYALPEDSLRNPRIQLSVEFLINSVGRNPSHDWPIGPRGHALRAMALYNQRVFGAEVGQMSEYIANTPAVQR